MQKNKLYHILSYIPFLFILSLLIERKNDPAVVFHRRQGIVLTIFSAASGIVSGVVAFGIGWIPFIGRIVPFALRLLLGLCVIVLSVIGIFHAVREEEIPLPFIGHFGDRY